MKNARYLLFSFVTYIMNNEILSLQNTIKLLKSIESNFNDILY